MTWFSRFFRRPDSGDRRAALLNEGLALAMEFGQDWLKPIQPRLLQRYPALGRAELDELDGECRAAMSFGHKVTYEHCVKFGKTVSVATIAPAVRAKFPWVSEANMARLFSQGMYYAYKDGAVPL